MRILLDQTGRCIGLGNQPNWPYEKPMDVNITFENFSLWVCNNLLDINNPAAWTMSDPPPVNAQEQKARDIQFGNDLLFEFLTGQRDISLDNATYRAVSETFKFAEAALRRGDIPQAKTELSNIAPSPPVWTEEAQVYFINKINQYLGI